MTGEDDAPEQDEAIGINAGSQLRAVRGPIDANDEPPPEVRLRREFKGLTIADLNRDEILARLPGQVRSALRHIERGDLEAAERVLPGHFAKVLEGPRPARSQRWGAALLVSVLAVVVAALLNALMMSLAGS